jgi:hypothetical protein
MKIGQGPLPQDGNHAIKKQIHKEIVAHELGLKKING